MFECHLWMVAFNDGIGLHMWGDKTGAQWQTCREATGRLHRMGLGLGAGGRAYSYSIEGLENMDANCDPDLICLSDVFYYYYY